MLKLLATTIGFNAGVEAVLLGPGCAGRFLRERARLFLSFAQASEVNVIDQNRFPSHPLNAGFRLTRQDSINRHAY